MNEYLLRISDDRFVGWKISEKNPEAIQDVCQEANIAKLWFQFSVEVKTEKSLFDSGQLR